MIGQTLAHYRIESRLGEGGMGVVYRAFDTRLDRQVAVKLLLPTLLADPRRRERFVREAKAASALNHPNIVTIHEIRLEDGVDFIVMENVEGSTLDQLIPAGGLAVGQALQYAVQITDALAKAHAAGIVHRDVKPSNVMVTDDGRVKVLDFGLAKLSEPEPLSPDAATVPDHRLTEEGTLVGTLEYMSPEQAEGKKVDARSDIFSFGAMFYQMITGRRPFAAESRARVLGKIISEDSVPPGQLAAIPAELDKVILRCLRKDPARRYQTMADLKVALEDLHQEVVSSSKAHVIAAPGRARRWRGSLLITLVVIAGAVAAYYAWRSLRAPLQAPLEASALTTFSGIENYPSLSPDGNHVAFTWNGPQRNNRDIYIQLIGSGSPLRLTSDPKSDLNPMWSPDGRWIAFLRGDSELLSLTTREIVLVPPLGGQERKLAEVRGRELHDYPQTFLAWCPDSSCLIVTDSPGEGLPDALFVVSTETGEKRQLTRPVAPAMGDSNPAVSGDGRALVFRRTFAWSSGELLIQPLNDNLNPAGEPRRLTDISLNAAYPVWMPDGKTVLFSAREGVWRMNASGEERPERIPFVGQDALMLTVARRGPGVRLVYARNYGDTNIWRIDVPSPGAPAIAAPTSAISSTRFELHPRISPDGRRVAFTSTRSGHWEIWLSDLDGGNATQLTSMRARTTGGPMWSPDGRQIAFGSNREGEFDIYMVAATGGAPRRITSDPGFDQSATFSRDGKSIYFCSNRTGAFQIWKSDLRGGDLRQITTDGGWVAFESLDGNSLYYLKEPDFLASSLWRVALNGGKPVELARGIVWWSFWLAGRGIYYVDRDLEDGSASATGSGARSGTTDRTRLRYLDPTTGIATTVAGLGPVECCITTTPDGRTILYARIDSAIEDLMLVEDFR